MVILSIFDLASQNYKIPFHIYNVGSYKNEIVSQYYEAYYFPMHFVDYIEDPFHIYDISIRYYKDPFLVFYIFPWDPLITLGWLYVPRMVIIQFYIIFSLYFSLRIKLAVSITVYSKLIYRCMQKFGRPWSNYMFC